MKVRNCYLDVPELYRLDTAMMRIRDVWIEEGTPYLVGSVMERPDYRDVDVRLMIGDDVWARFDREHWLFLNAAVSDQLKAATGLPIDFQFQSVTVGNEYHGTRRPLGFAHPKNRAAR